jgi:phosphomannomutase
MAALLHALELVSEAGKPLSQVIAPLDHRFRSGEINSEVADVAATMQAIEERYRAEGAAIDHLDGITVEFPTWWFNVRPSNTQPLLRLNVEADDPETLRAKTDEVLAMIRSGAGASA